MKQHIKAIIGKIKMVDDSDTENGLVSADEVPLDEALRLVRELTEAGVEASWAPSERSEHQRDATAWLYVRE